MILVAFLFGWLDAHIHSSDHILKMVCVSVQIGVYVVYVVIICF
jgi:biotin transporter BioY